MPATETAVSLAQLAASLSASPDATRATLADLALARRLLGLDDRGRIGPASADPNLSAAFAAGERVTEALTAAMRASTASPDEPQTLETLRRGIAELVRAEPAHELDELVEAGTYDLAVRRVPLAASHSSLSPPHVAGRAVARTLGPFTDAAGLPVWVDLFLRVRDIAMVRAPGTEPLLRLPLRGIVTPATQYRLPAGTIWILSRLLAPTAPPGGYCGIRIKGGSLSLSAPAAVSGETLQIAASVTATLDIETEPASEAGGTLGLDGDAARSKPPGKARFVFTSSQVLLERADDAELTAYGVAETLSHQPGQPARMEALVHRVWLPFEVVPGRQFRIRQVRSDLFQPTGATAKIEGAWALAVTVPASPNSLGPAEGAGAVALRLSPGLRAGWRGLAGGPVRLGETVVMTEPGRLTLAAAREPGQTTRQTLKLWHEPGAGPDSASQVALSFAAPGPVRFLSEAATGDLLQAQAALEASFDRPIGVDSFRFPLRGPAAAMLLSKGSGGFQALILADVSTPSASYRGPQSLALTNALLRLAPPSALLISGAWDMPDRVRAGLAAVLFGVRALIPTLRDPYVTNYALPLQRDVAGVPASASGAGRLVATIRWSAPEAPELAVFLAPATPSSAGLIGVLPSDVTPATFGAGRDAAARAEEEDAAADRAMRQLFERTAGPIQERLLLLDVSSSIDQLGVGFGVGRRDDAPSGAPDLGLQIAGLDLTLPSRNLRIILLPQFQWEPVVNQPNPFVGPFPDRLASADDGGATVLGTPSVTLVPVAPERLAETMLQEFNVGPAGTPLAAKFTLPFGMKAVARFEPESGAASRWASLQFHRPATTDGRFTGGLQIRAESHPDQGPELESPSFPGAAWQTRNGIDPITQLPLGLSALSSSFGNPGVEKYFNDEMGPSGTRPRVPVTRIEFSGYGSSIFSAWANPNAVSATSEVRFDVLVGRTAYEVVQIASPLYCCAAPLVRTITLERKKEGAVIRFDSGWVPTGPGLYRYPSPDPGVVVPAGWTAIETHPGVVRGFWNIRRIRETNRVVARDFPPEGARPGIRVELLEVRFDADLDIEGVVKGAGGDGRVPSLDQVGYVQRAPIGYPLLPEHLAAILEDEGPAGGPVDCAIDIAQSGQILQVARADVAPAPVAIGGPPHFAAAARGALALPSDGEWSAIRHQVSVAEPQPVDVHAGVPLIRVGTASGSVAPSSAYRVAEPADLLQESAPDVEFSLVQGSEGHRVLFPRPRIISGALEWSSTELPRLADTYTLSLGVGVTPPQPACFVGEAPWGLAINGASKRFTLLPTPTMRFTAPPAVADRLLVDTAPFKIRTRYESEMRFTLDPTQTQAWEVEGDSIFTTMDLGPFSELLGIRHGFRVAAGEAPAFIDAKTIYPPPLQPVVEVLEFLATLLGTDKSLTVDGHQGSFGFKAILAINIVNPKVSDGFIDFGGFAIKGKLALGVASAPVWNGFLKFNLGSRVPVLPPIFGEGEITVGLEGTALAEQKVTIEVKWGATIGKSLGPLEVQAKFYFAIQVITSNTGSWQIGVLIGISGTANIWIAKLTLRLELLAAIKLLSPAEAPPSGAKQAIGQAKVAADVTIAVFVTITVEVTVQVTETLNI